MMSYNEIKRIILLKYHKDLSYWWGIVGEMFEATDGFTKKHKIKRMLGAGHVYISWDNYSWDIEMI